jgi:hypothetical protein
MIAATMKVLEVKAGIPIVVYYEGNYYDIRKENKIEIKEENKEPKKRGRPKKIQPSLNSFDFSSSDKGKQVGKISTVSIYDNVLSAVSDAIENKTSVDKVIKNFYPTLKKRTRICYAWAYNRYLGKNDKDIIPLYNNKKVDAPKIKSSKKDRGNFLQRKNHTTLFENIYNEISPLIERDAPKSEIFEVLKTYGYSPKEINLTCYYSQYKRYYKEQNKKGTETKDVRGKIVTHISNIPIYENVYKSVAMELERNINADLIPLLKTWYPNSKPSSSSVQVYSYIYRNYYYSKNKNTENNNDLVLQEKTDDNVLEDAKPYIRKYRKRKPKDAHGRSKKYKTWIRKDWYDVVKRAVHKFNFVATTKSISKETGLPVHKVNATLDYLKQNCEIYMTRSGTLNRTPVYHPAITGKEEL